jgi:hypothetical protein
MTMAIAAKQRWILYAVALVLTLVAVRWAGGQDRTEAQPAAPAPRAERPVRDADPARADAVPEVRLDLLGKRAAVAPAGDPFRAQSWEPPVEQRVRRAAPPPPPPQAPPIPFAYMGKLVDEGTTTVFLARADRNYVVRAGDTIDGTYRIEKVGDEALEFVYLPLKAKQTLPFTATAAPAAASPPAGGGEGSRSRRPMPDNDEDDD